MSDCRVMGRATQGVRLINLTKKNDVIASVCKVMSSELEEKVAEEQTANDANDNGTATASNALDTATAPETETGHGVAEDTDNGAEE